MHSSSARTTIYAARTILTMNGLLDSAAARRLRVGQDVNVQLDNGVNVSGTLVQLWAG